MSELPKFLLIVTAEIDASVEASWNKWCDEEHLPAALACPGVLQEFVICPLVRKAGLMTE